MKTYEKYQGPCKGCVGTMAMVLDVRRAFLIAMDKYEMTEQKMQKKKTKQKCYRDTLFCFSHLHIKIYSYGKFKERTTS